MPALTDIRLTDAIVLAGPAYEQVQGYGDDKFSLGEAGDVGSMISGVDGDVTMIDRVQNAWNITFTFTVGALGITLLKRLHTTLRIFPVKVSYGDFGLVGWMKMINMGEMAASLGNTARTMTAGIAKVSGNTDVAPGRVVQVL